jgi:hypothetical protein
MIFLFIYNAVYCPLPKRMQLAYTHWAENCNTRDYSRGRGGVHTDAMRNMHLCHRMAFFPLVAVC